MRRLRKLAAGSAVMAAAAAVAATTVLTAGTGVSLAARTLLNHPPRFYVEFGDKTLGKPQSVVRSTTTGAITGSVGCPRHETAQPAPVVPADNQMFYLACGIPGPLPGSLAAAQVYRFHVTSAGRVSGYTAVRGGRLTGVLALFMAVTPDGSELAVNVVPPAQEASPVAPLTILVINTRTGAQAVWHAPASAPGTIRYPVGSLSLTADGRELVFLTQPKCITGKNAPRCRVTGGQQVRALSDAGGGGPLAHAKVIVRQSALGSLSATYIDDAVITPDGSKVTLTLMRRGSGIDSITGSVVQVRAATGKIADVLYRVRTGNGFLFRFLSADPSGRYLLLDVGPAAGPVNGWIHDGHLTRLKPDGSLTFWEAW